MSGRFYASQHYKQSGKTVIITGEKFDVTNDIAAAVLKYGVTFTEVKKKKAAL